MRNANNLPIFKYRSFKKKGQVMGKNFWNGKVIRTVMDANDK